MAELLSVAHMDLFRGETQVLWDISIAVAPGERVAILGSNGAGKSSFLGGVTAAIPPAAGEIRFDGQSLVGLRPHEVTGLGIALVPEGRRVYKDMSVRENLEMGAFPKSARSRMKQSLEHVIQLFPILGQRRGQPAGTLSGGEQQMLALARALAVPPKLIIADEMSLGLAPIVVDAVFESIAQAAASGVTIVLIEQFIHRALALATQCVILMRGSVAWTGSAANAEQEILDRYLGESAEAMT